MGKKTKVTVETMAFESNELKMSSVSETMTADNNMLKGAALEKSTLGKASFERSFLGEASFENASVEKSYLSEPSLEKASFESVSLGSSSMEKGSLKEVSFVELKDGDSFTMVDKSLVSEPKEAQLEVADATEEGFFGSFLEVEDTEDYEMQLMEQLQMIWFLQNYALMEEAGMISDTGDQVIDSPIDERILISPYPLVKVTEFHVTRRINEHDTAVVKGIIDEATANMYRMMLDTTQKVSITFRENETEKLLFNGFLDKIIIGSVGEFKQVELRFSGLTKAMDRGKGFRDFQSNSKSTSDIIGTITNGYSNIPTISAFTDNTVSEFVLQYEETDYEFLQRILSKNKEVIYTSYYKNKGSVVLGGIHSNQIETFLETDYKISIEKKDVFSIKTEKVLDLCAQVNFFGKILYVCETKYELVDGELKFTYKLVKESGITSIPRRNPRVVGISLDGSVTGRNRNMVTIALNGTCGMDNDSARWFPYSSPAASSDGSGWFCMPEVGEQVRLYSPTDDEKEAYVVSAIKGGGGDDPANKSLSSADGSAVIFTGDGVMVASSDGKAVMNLSNTGDLVINAESDIKFCSDNGISLHSEGEVILQGSNSVTASDEGGGKIVLDGTIDISGLHIYNNSNY
ncbi:MAG: hypothetical protein J6U66_05370 [Lachnospiraceae bacterium]|nr:hypothetical protein [Lachnospiraceae bacterium]